MKAPPAEILELMTAAAGLRAAGLSWPAVGLELEQDEEVCRQWATEYPRVWSRLYRQAAERQAEEVVAEAIIILRQLSRSDDTKTSAAAAAQLLKLRAKPRPRRPTKPGHDIDPELTAFFHDVQELTDAQLDQTLRNLHAEMDWRLSLEGR